MGVSICNIKGNIKATVKPVLLVYIVYSENIVDSNNDGMSCGYHALSVCRK